MGTYIVLSREITATTWTAAITICSLEWEIKDNISGTPFAVLIAPRTLSSLLWETENTRWSIGRNNTDYKKLNGNFLPVEDKVARIFSVGKRICSFGSLRSGTNNLGPPNGSMMFRNSSTTPDWPCCYCFYFVSISGNETRNCTVMKEAYHRHYNHIWVDEMINCP